MLAPVRVIGLMSGTSADGVDAALVEWPDEAAAKPFRLLAAREDAYDPALQARIHALAAGELEGPRVLGELAALDSELADRFADAAVAVARDAGVPLAELDAVASHGQTVAHHPEHAASLQIGNPARISERVDIPVVADFRSRDLAAGGQGAPLAPFFHFAVFSQRGEARAALNLGGIANLTWLPPDGDPDAVVAFDSGPANSLIDGVLYAATRGAERFDEGGARAARGDVETSLLERLLDDEYLAAAPPKSTGRERYGRAEAEALVREWRGRPLDDLVATLAAFTVASIVGACRDHLPAAPERLVVGGGGVRNPVLMAALSRDLPGCRVEPFDALGVPADAAEAMAFSLLGRNTLLGIPNHLPRTTGASHATILGNITPASPGGGRS
jgi:anhydro-N-acetylmuramic acid kinase